MPIDNDDDKTRAMVRLEPGLAIDHYTIVEQIGAGGMGEVYLADDSRLRRQVALKFMPAHCCTDPELKNRFLREARAAAALNHPNILTIHDIGEFRDRPFIVMEYFPGESLKAYLRGRQPKIDSIVRIALQIAEGIACAHRHGIVHRDVKSDNILIDPHGHVKIVDFGLALVASEAALTQPGTTLGTVSYMAPEQARGRPADERSDLFSLGVVLYELVSGRLPFAREHPGAIIQAIINEEPESLASGRDDLPAGLSTIIERLLRKDPKDRYRSASALAEDLRRLAERHEIVSPSRGKGKRLALTGAALALLIVAAAWIVGWPPGPESAGRSDDRTMLVVLPFENLGVQTDEYFATGIADEISTHLTKLSGLGVISRSSASQYESGSRPYREIGRELGVDYILEGSVRWDKSAGENRVRITTTLQSVSDNVSVWAENYDRVLDDIFAVQTDIARNVTAAMNVHVLESEEQSIGTAPTESIQAYTFYMQGRDYFADRQWSLAETMFQRAIALDSTFAAAWAMLSRTHSLRFWWYEDRTEHRLTLARDAASTALKLDSSLAEAYLAMGRYYYRGRLDYDRAIQHYERALALAPNNAEVLFALGSANRRQGAWSEAVDFFRRARVLDPRSKSVLRTLAETYLYQRVYDSAAVFALQYYEMAPDDNDAIALSARIAALGYGDFAGAWELIDSVPKPLPLDLIDLTVLLHTLEHDYESARQILLANRTGEYFRQDSGYYYLQMGEINYGAKRNELARVYYDSARVVLAAAVGERPDDAGYQSMLGVAYAGVGNDSAAVDHGLRAVSLVGVDQDAVTGTFWRQNLALIYALLGRRQKARNEIEFLLSTPSALTPVYVQKHPILGKI